MGTMRRFICGLVGIGLLSMGVSAGTTVGRGDPRQLKILVEARTVQISDALWTKLDAGKGGPVVKDVTLPLASLLYALGEPNAVRTIAAARAQARVGQTEVVSTGQKMKFLVPTPSGGLEPQTTDTPIGTTLTVQPLALHEGKIQLHVKFRHSEAVRPQKMDPASALPIGPPMFSTQDLVNGALHLTPGEPIVAGGLSSSGLHTYTLIRAEVLPN